MDSKNKIQSTKIEVSFSIPKEMAYLYWEIGKPKPKQQNKSIVQNTLERSFDLDPKIAKTIEVKLKLNFMIELKETGNVCMANSPEVRDEYKNNFYTNDILHYIYAILYSPGYHEKNNKFAKNLLFQIPYPSNPNCFWKLVSLGTQLKMFHLLRLTTLKNYTQETDEILKDDKIAGLK